MLLADDGNSRFLPIRIARHARTITQETVLSAQVSRRWVDLLERATFAVRFGALSSLEIRVPAGIADRWELLEKELVDREELGREPDGARRYRLSFARPVVDKATLRFRYRLPLVPGLDAKTVREITIPEIIVQGRAAGADEGGDVARAGDRSQGDGQGLGSFLGRSSRRADRRGCALSRSKTEIRARGSRPFTFKALALEPVPLPSFVVPRLLLKTVSGGDDTIRTSALYWVESHGPDFPFALPEGARWIGARVDGRLAEQVDYDPARVSYRLRFPGEVGSQAGAGRARVPVERTGHQIEMAGSAAARWRRRPPDPVGSAAALEHGPARRPERMVR